MDVPKSTLLLKMFILLIRGIVFDNVSRRKDVRWKIKEEQNRDQMFCKTEFGKIGSVGKIRKIENIGK